jgi:NAD(P)H-hydrate epimerase
MKILDAPTMQAWEERTINSADNAETATISLMRQAVAGLHQAITDRFPAGRCLIACGKGNNGNDALWLAYSLQQSGWQVTTWLTHPQSERTTVNTDPVRKSLENALTFPEKPTSLFTSSTPLLIIDGILGLGAAGAPRGTSAEMISWLMQQRRPQDVCLSIDTPSGLNASSGEIFTPCFQADFTVAIGAVKSGCLNPQAASAVGRLSAIPIALCPPMPQETSESTFFTIENARELLQHRAVDTYKHRQGSVGIWAGSPGMAGAAILASRAALRSGAGLIRLFTHEDLAPQIMASTPEIMVEPLTLSKKLNVKLLKSDTILVGPGIGTDAATARQLEELISTARNPLVLDADALTLCGADPQLHQDRPTNLTLSSLPPDTILTPHSGEFSRLLPQQSASRYDNAKMFTSLNPKLVLCLKGPNTLIASKAVGLSYNGSGNPGMATAGAGDVLAGLIAGLRARGFSAYDSTCLGAFWHGFAGDLAAINASEDSLSAGDIISMLGAARSLISRP